MGLSKEEKKEIIDEIIKGLCSDREDRPNLTNAEVKSIKDLVSFKKNTVKAVLWIVAIIITLALKDIWGVVFEFFKRYLKGD